MFSDYVASKNLDFGFSIVLFCELYSADKRTEDPWPFVVLLPATENKIQIKLNTE